MSLSEALTLLAGKKALTAADAVALRRIVYGDDQFVGQVEAEALFKLNADADSSSPEWREFFVEAITDHVVHQETPSGYIDQAKADWLIGQIKGAGRVREDEIEMLIHALEEADESPAILSNFVLELVKGPILQKLQNSRRLDRDDIERMRRVIYSKGGDGNIAVTRHEAEALFDINDALNGADTDPAWLDLFKRAVANAVLFVSPWHSDRAAQQTRDNWLADTRIRPFHRMGAALDPATALNDMREEAHDLAHLDFQDHFLDRAYAAEEKKEADAESLTDDETHWLIERIRRTGRIDKNERAVVEFIRDNARSSDKEVASLVAALDEFVSATPA